MSANVESFPARSTDLPIFDVDTHWAEPRDLWTSRAPAKFKDRVMHVERSETGHEYWYISGKRLSPVGPSVIDKKLHKHLQTFSLASLDLMADASTFPRARVAVMDQLGIGSQIVYPNAIGIGATQAMQSGDDIPLRMFHIQAYNDALAEMQRESGNRILGQMVLPLWDIEASIAEMKRCREKLRLTGITMSDHPEDWGQPPLSTAAWDPFWAEAQNLDIPVNFHIASGSFENLFDNSSFWNGTSFFKDEGEMEFNGPNACFQASTLYMSNQNVILNLLLTGMLDKFPKLRFVSAESGLSWIPFLIQTLEMQFTDLMSKEDRAMFSRTPTQAFVEQIFVSYWFENRNSIDFYIAEFGAENLMFQTDFPHPVALYPGVQPKIAETMAGRPDEIVRNALYRNAERVYGMPVGKVAVVKEAVAA